MSNITDWLKSHKNIVGIGCGCAVVGFLLVIVSGVLAWFFVPQLLGKSEVITFVPYEKTDVFDNSWGAPAGITIKLDVPEGDHPQVESAIREIVRQSELGQQIGEPIGETLQLLADNCMDNFMEAVGRDEFGGPVECILLVESDYQNAESVVFHVTDGIFVNGGPREYDQVVRRKDGHVMEQTEMIGISPDVLKELATKYAVEDLKDQVWLDDGYYLSPCAEGVKLLWPIGSHFIGDCIIPLADLEQYLTDEGKTIFKE